MQDKFLNPNTDKARFKITPNQGSKLPFEFFYSSFKIGSGSRNLIKEYARPLDFIKFISQQLFWKVLMGLHLKIIS